MHRKSDGQRFAQFRVSSPELCVAVKVVTVCAGPHPSHARPPSDTPGGHGGGSAAGWSGYRDLGPYIPLVAYDTTSRSDLVLRLTGRPGLLRLVYHDYKRA